MTIEPSPHSHHHRRTQAYGLFLCLTCLLYLSISLSEVPNFDAVLQAERDDGQSKHWRFFAQHSQGKEWYETLIEVACIVAFAGDIVCQVRLVSRGWGWLGRLKRNRGHVFEPAQC